MSGLITRLHYDSDGDKLIAEAVQDVEPVMNFTKAFHLDGFHGRNDFRFAGSIPQVLIEKYCEDNGITFAEWMEDGEHQKRMLNDPDLSVFRIWPGRI